MSFTRLVQRLRHHSQPNPAQQRDASFTWQHEIAGGTQASRATTLAQAPFRGEARVLVSHTKEEGQRKMEGLTTKVNPQGESVFITQVR